MLPSMTKMVSSELQEAAASGDVEAAIRALDAGASLWDSNLAGQNAFMLTIAHQEEDLGLLLLGRMLESQRNRSWLLQTAKTTGNNYLHQCISSQTPRLLNVLLKVAGDLRPGLLRQSNAQGTSPFFMAIDFQNERSLALLLKFDRDLLEECLDGFSPLSRAIHEDSGKITEALLKQGASVLLPPQDPAWSQVKTVEMLERLAKRPELSLPSARTGQADSLLQVLVKRGAALKLPLLKASRRLLKDDGLLKERNARQQTLLHLATANRCSPDVVDFLVKEGLFWTAVDVDGQTPLDNLPTGANAYTQSQQDRWHSQQREQSLDQALPGAKADPVRVRF